MVTCFMGAPSCFQTHYIAATDSFSLSRHWHEPVLHGVAQRRRDAGLRSWQADSFDSQTFTTLPHVNSPKTLISTKPVEFQDRCLCSRQARQAATSYLPAQA